MSEIFSFVIAVLSLILTSLNILIPAIISNKNSRQEQRLKKIELIYENKFSAYREFAKAHANMRLHSSYKNASEFISSLEIAISVSDGELREELLSIFSILISSKFQSKNNDDLFEIDDETDAKIKKCIELIGTEYTTYISAPLQTRTDKIRKK